jgi:hypothetical protein
MLIRVIYNKNTGEITLEKDVLSVLTFELNQSSIVDTSQEVSFEISLSTAEFEMPEQESPTSLPE